MAAQNLTVLACPRCLTGHEVQEDVGVTIAPALQESATAYADETCNRNNRVLNMPGDMYGEQIAGLRDVAYRSGCAGVLAVTNNP